MHGRVSVFKTRLYAKDHFTADKLYSVRLLAARRGKPARRRRIRRVCEDVGHRKVRIDIRGTCGKIRLRPVCRNAPLYTRLVRHLHTENKSDARKGIPAFRIRPHVTASADKRRVYRRAPTLRQCLERQAVSAEIGPEWRWISIPARSRNSLFSAASGQTVIQPILSMISA